MAKTVKAQRDELAAMLEEILSCPYTLDSASVPKKGGIEANPAQVVGVLSIGILRIRKAQDLLESLSNHEEET